MKQKPSVAEKLDEAIRALEALKAGAIESDNRLNDAVRSQAQAEKQAEKDRRTRDEAIAKVSGLEQRIVEVRGSVAAEVETLRAEKEMLAARDRESRVQLEQLSMSRGKQHTQQIKSRGITETVS